MLNFIAKWRSERVAVRELTRLHDRSLADLGIQRADIKAIVQSAAFAARDAVEPTTAPRRSDPVGSMAPSWAAHIRRALV